MSNAHLFAHIPAGVHVALWQMFKDGPIRDGNLVDKTARSWLASNGYADRKRGFNFLTIAGVDLAVTLGMDRKKERGDD